MDEFDVRDRIHENGQALGKGMQENGLYILLVDQMKHESLVHDSDKLWNLWHKQFHHL